MARQRPKSLVSPNDTTVNDRRMVAATADNSAPTLPQQGVSCVDYDEIELTLSAATTGAGTSYRARVFWFNAVAAQWVRDTVVGNQTITTTEPTGIVVQTHGASRVYVHVDTFGAGVTASVWATGLPVSGS